jgi:hypothetical protein
MAFSFNFGEKSGQIGPGCRKFFKIPYFFLSLLVNIYEKVTLFSEKQISKQKKNHEANN